MLMRTDLKPIAPWVDKVEQEQSDPVSNQIGWYILLVEPNGERRSAERLRRFKMPTYWPSYSVTVRHRGGLSRNKLLAMIPGYLFLPISPMRDDAWMVVHETPTIRGFIRDGNRMPAVMWGNDMQDIMCAEARLNSPIPDQIQTHKFKIGDQVKYLGNIYWQWDGVIAAIAKDGKLRIDGILMFGRPTSVWVRASEIEAMKV